jgi:hypothetical protein
MRKTGLRIGLAALGIPGAIVGAWAAFAPRSFYDDFPGLGQQWVSSDGPFNEHLVRDVGELSLGLALVALLAIVWLTPAIVRAAGIAWFVDGALHLVYHLRHYDALPADQGLASIASLGLGPLVAIVVLVLARDLGPSSAMIESSPPSSSSTMSPSAAPKARSSSI